MMVTTGMLSGCATGLYTAQNLPAEFRAQPTANVQTVQLAKLASPATQADQIANGDVLEVSISSGLSSERERKHTTRVDDEGMIFLSELGRIPVQGLDLESAEAMISTMCVNKQLYKSPTVTITTKQAKLFHVTVVGAVKEPKTYSLRSGQSNLLAALVAAGGLTEDAGTTVEIRHPGFRDGQAAPSIAAQSDIGQSGDGIQLASHEEPASASTADVAAAATTSQGNVVRIDLVQASQQYRGGYELPDGAIVHVEKHDFQPISVIGLVRKPGEFDFPVGNEMRLTSAIALAGDLSNPLADKIHVIRKIEGREEPVVINLSLKKAKQHGKVENFLLKPGDTVSVEKTPSTVIYEAIRIVSFGVGGSVF